jgi:carboxyl-terminal processing protease
MKRQHLIQSFTIGALIAAFLWSATNPRTFAREDYSELDRLAQVMHIIRTSYVQEVEEKTLIDGALRGMLDTLDPHSTYMSEKSFREMQVDTRGEFEGLGIEITQEDDVVTIISPIDGTPAQRAGLRAQDQIIVVCPDPEDEATCQSTRRMDLQQAVELMRGPRGKSILLRVMREGWDGPKPFVIKRDSIRVPTVFMHTIDKSIVYVRLRQFTEQAETLVEDALDEARTEMGREIGGLVLDLRDNPGGLLDQAVRVADIFLDEGVVVSSEGRNGVGPQRWNATGRAEPSYPIVVLVNGGSASASEIVAGALQDHKRGFVVGTETFGKGSVQTIYPLDSASGEQAGVRLTTQLYYLPSGRSIQEVRVQPDLVVEQYTEEVIAALSKSQRTQRRGEIDLEGHLSVPGAAPKPGASAKPGSPDADPSESSTDPATQMAARERAFREALRVDHQLMEAVALLKSAPIFAGTYQKDKERAVTTSQTP